MNTHRDIKRDLIYGEDSLRVFDILEKQNVPKYNIENIREILGKIVFLQVTEN